MLPCFSGDQKYGTLKKDIMSSPYENASIEGFIPKAPWGAPAAFADYQNKPFPSTEQLDEEYDSWPELI
eukprot:13389621-Ditylum_brightwellii.AAC.1